MLVTVYLTEQEAAQWGANPELRIELRAQAAYLAARFGKRFFEVRSTPCSQHAIVSVGEV